MKMSNIQGAGFPRSVLAALATVAILAGCTPGQPVPTRPDTAPASPPQPAGPKGTIKLAWPTEPEGLNPKLVGTGGGINQFYWVFNSFLTHPGLDGIVKPLLAQEVPTRDNGGWVVNADGTMVTTYRLRPNARWHDGVPLTAHDFAFAYDVYLDPDMPVRDRLPETLMSKVEAQEPQTLVITWKEPYIYANGLTLDQMPPLPRHLLEEKYRTNRSQFAFGAEWGAGYVGSGPFKVDQWDPGSRLIARANLDWFLGPPKLQTVEIRFISDARAALATLLSGDVDMTNTPAFNAAEAAVARDQWVARGEGYMKTWSRTTRFLQFQFREVPNWQRGVTDLRVRQALVHAIDRGALIEVATHGLGAEAYAFVYADIPGFGDVDRVLIKHGYDPNRAAALLADAGWSRPQPGTPLTNASGQPLTMELWTTSGGGGGAEPDATLIDDNWRTMGATSSIYVIPPSRQRDNELRTSFPAVNLTSRNPSVDNFGLTSANLPTPEARWQGANRGSFRDEDVDRLHGFIMTSFDERERHRANIALQRRMTETLGAAPLYYDPDFLFAKHRVKGPISELPGSGGIAWNIFEWEVTD